MLYKDSLVESYPIRIRVVACIIIIFIALSAYIFPRFLDSGIKNINAKNENFEAIDVPPPTSQIERIKPPPRPSVPVASEDEDFDMEISIQDTNVDNFEEYEPPSFGSDLEIVELYLVSDPPKPRKGFEVEKFLDYPELAREMQQEGTVFIRALINKKGRVIETSISRGVIDILDEAAEAAVKKSIWTPAKQNTKRVVVWISIPVKFKLK